MKAYIYKPSDIGRADWPSGELRLEGFEPTENPEEADVFICPGNLSLFKDDFGALDRFPFMSQAEDRHVFLDVSDNFTKAIGKRCIFIKCDVRDWMLAGDPNSISFAWPVEDFAECIDLPEGGFKYDVSFQGWLSTDTRKQSAIACESNPALDSDIATYADFCGYIYYEPEGIRRRAEFRRSMRESRISLCPESIPGVFPYRFFEAMSAGRVPLLVSSDYVLPFENQIPYREFMIQIPRQDASRADEAVLDFLASHYHDEIVEMGRKARHYWKLWLNREDWPSTMGWAVKNQLELRKVAAL